MQQAQQTQAIDSFIKSGAIISLDRDTLLLGYGNGTWSDKPLEAYKGQSFYFPHFFLHDPYIASAPPWLNYRDTLQIKIDPLLAALQNLPQTKPQIQWKKPLKEKIEVLFHQLKAKIFEKELLKAVPFIMEEGGVDLLASHRVYLLCQLLKYLQRYPAFLYGFWQRDHGLLGATPELLFTIDPRSHRIESMACAGTAKSAEILKNSDKDHKEHQLVVDGIREALQPFGTFYQGKQEIVNVGTISHLITPLSLQLKNPTDFETIVHALHPTPALGAYPKKAGEQWLRNYQTMFNRERFGAPAGVVTTEGGRCYVAIRNMQWGRGFAKICAGSGVVAESLFEVEWKEMQNKIAAIKRNMGI